MWLSELRFLCLICLSWFDTLQFLYILSPLLIVFKFNYLYFLVFIFKYLYILVFIFFLFIFQPFISCKKKIRPFLIFIAFFRFEYVSLYAFYWSCVLLWVLEKFHSLKFSKFVRVFFCAFFLPCHLRFQKFCHNLLIQIWFSLFLFKLFLFVFSSFLKFCGEFTLSKCWGFDIFHLRVFQPQERPWLREEILFVECLECFSSIAASFTFLLTSFSLIVCYLFFLFLCYGSYFKWRIF